MGTVLGQSINESKKIDTELFLSKYSEKYELKSFLKQGIFNTLLVTSKKDSNYDPGIPFVIKLFPISNDNYLKYSQEFTEIKNLYSNLESSPNVVPIIKLDQMKEANAGIIIRQYIKYNLKQALYYLTCTSEVEKKWICFQLLQGLRQIHSKLKCHGDIKPENILVSSKLSVFFSDISVYKPVYIIIENLQLYNTFFYCNSVDRACYLAPERFVEKLDEVNNNLNELTQEMDIFSLGVVFAEIFLDKQNIFTQNDLINYKIKKIDIREKLNGINDINIRNVIKNMIDIEPKKRIRLPELIIFFGDNLCPSPITRFIAHLNLMIIVYGYYRNDLLVALLYKHFIQIWKSLCINNKNLENMKIPKLKKNLNKYLILQLLSNKYNIYKIKCEFPLAFIQNDYNDKKNKEVFIESEINSNFFINTNYNMGFYNNNPHEIEDDCTIIIIKYLLSCLENIKYISTYSSIFEMIYNLSKILVKKKNWNIIIDLIVPNYINLFEINNSKVNIEAYNSLIEILNLINYDELILNKIDYNAFNYYIFESIYQHFLKTEKLEVKCAIISRLDEIIELENNFLFAYLNTNNNIIINEKNKDKNKNNQYYQDLLFKTYLNNKNIKESQEIKKSIKNDVDFNSVYNCYLNDRNSFKKKLKDFVKKILEEEENKNDCLKLLIIQKYREICLFFGNFNENRPLFNHLFILFNQNNYYIQKEIIKIFPSLILLFGNKLFYDYFLSFIESSCQKKNSELIIIEIIDALILLLKMNLIHHKDEYSKSYKILICYKLLIPYIIHPNYLLRSKLNILLNQVISDENSSSELYIFFYKNIKKILSENNNSITVINVINKDLINKINKYYFIPREIFLMYKYNIDCNYFNANYIDKTNLLSEITKIKKEHFVNKIKNDLNMRNNLGLINKNDIFSINPKSFLKNVNEDFIKISKIEGFHNDKNSIFIQKNFKNKITILLNEINENTKNKKFLNKWFHIFCSKKNINYSKIIFLLKVLNYKLDIKDIITNNLAEISDTNLNKETEYKDWNVLDDIESSNFKSINPMSYITKENKNPKFCFELYLNPSESIIKLIPVNCFFTGLYLNFFVSISNEGVVRLHIIYKDNNFENIYIIKNRAQYKYDIGDYIIKSNHISYVEKKNKIMIMIVIKCKIEILTFELNNEKYSIDTDNLVDSCVCNNMECKSSKEIISIENMVKPDKNYVVLGNCDNSISFYNYIDNSIDYVNNCSDFSASYGNIELIISLINSDNILISTSYGFLILYDFNLRLFTTAFSFSKRKRINQIIEYIPNNINSSLFESKKIEYNTKNIFIFILTNDDLITLWNLSLTNPIIIYELIKVNKIEDHKKIKTAEIFKQKMEIINLQNQNYSIWSEDDFAIENQFVKMNINFIWDIKASSYEIITGEKQGICRALNFSYENLKKIRHKQGHKNNKFSQIIFDDNNNNNKNVQVRNNSKYIKEEEVYINKLIYTINSKTENKNIKEDFKELKEMNDLIVLRDYFSSSNIEFIISGYSDGTIKLWSV